MLPFERIPLEAWAPDQPDYPSVGAVEARNVVPYAASYGPWKRLEALSAAAAEPILNVFWTRVGETTAVIAGTPTRLLQLNGTTWTVRGSGFTTPPAVSWEFVAFGNFVYAVAPGIDPQVIDLTITTPAFAAATGAPEAPPRAKRAAVVSDFVVFGDLDSDETVIQWSGYNNAGIWDKNGSSLYQADAQKLYEGGRVQKIVGGPYGLIFQEERIRILRYVGPPLFFSIQVVDRERGAVAPDSVVAAGEKVFFYAQDGFQMFNGQQAQPIGQERVNRWFKANAATSELGGVRASVDRTNNLVFFAFKTVAGASTYDLALVYNYAVDRWSYVEVEATGVFEIEPAGYTLDTLDTLVPSIDGTTESVDSDAFSGGALRIVGTTLDGVLGSFSGLPRTAVIDTREFDGPQNTRRSLSCVRPLVQKGGASVKVNVGRRDSLAVDPVYAGERGLNSVGEAPILSDARYHRVRLTIDGEFEHASAVDVMSRPSGRF